MSFCDIDDLRRTETVCKLTNNRNEVRDIVVAIRRGLAVTESADGISGISAALTHLCYMIEGLEHQADVRLCVDMDTVIRLLSTIHVDAHLHRQRHLRLHLHLQLYIHLRLR